METKMNLDKNPAGSLVTEHRLLDRYLLLMKKQAELMDRGKNPDRVFIERLIDFFKTYAHRCHYGKEEEILFQRLYVKRLLPEHKRVIDGLVLEHIRERGLLDRLEIAKDKFWLGESQALHGNFREPEGHSEVLPGTYAKGGKGVFLSQHGILQRRGTNGYAPGIRRV